MRNENERAEGECECEKKETKVNESILHSRMGKINK